MNNTGDKAEENSKEATESKPKSKNAIKREARWQRLKEAKARKKQEEKLRKKTLKAENKRPLEEEESSRPSKRTIKENEKANLKRGLESGVKIAIDLQYGNLMNDKELVHLASQIRRLYGENKKAVHPAHIHIVGLDSRCEKVLVDKNDGFENYILTKTEKSLTEFFPEDETRSRLIYLSPDAERSLEKVEKDKIYVIGGLVDDSVKKKATFDFAGENKISAFKLPISEYCDREEGGSFKQILTINQVFGILLKYLETSDWKEAFEAELPKRIGFKPKEEQK